MVNHSHNSLDKLLTIIEQLRDPINGCPWDIKQTHDTLKPYLIEEAYEAVSAIDEGADSLKMELGDVLLQIVLHAQIAKEKELFSFNDIVEVLTEKLIYRHPHVFKEKNNGEPVALCFTNGAPRLTEDEVLSQWEKLKAKKATKGIVSDIPKALPALLKAQRVSEKAARVGFEWDSLEGVKEKILEEIAEFVEARKLGDSSKEVQEEFGDIFFALVQLARRLHLDAEQMLQQSTQKFIERFEIMENLSLSKPLYDLSLQEFDVLWEKAKQLKKDENTSNG